MLSTYLIIRRLGIANLRLDQAIILFHNFLNLKFIMTKRFESGASKRKRKKFENDMVKKIKPITAFLHQPLTEATGAGSEVGALTLAQENQCDEADQPTASIQPEESLTEKAMQDVEQQPGNEEGAMPSENENTSIFQNSVAAKGGEKETHESSGDSQNFQFTPGEVNQSKAITDTYADDAEHRSTHTMSLKDVGLWKELSNEEIAYWIERGSSEVQHSCGPFSSSKRVYKKQSRFCTKALFYATKVNGETYSREWLVYSPAKGRVYCFVCKLFPNHASSSALASDGFDDWHNSYLIQTHENSEKHTNAMLTYLTRKRGYTLTSKLEEQIKVEQQYWWHVMERIAAVICTLAERGLPFRGDNEQFGSPNNGNYLGLLELVAKFDPFLLAHINRYGNSGSGNPS